MATLRIVGVEEQAVLCRKCDRCMVGGTLPPRYSLCGGCATADSRPRVSRHMKRSRWRRRADHFLDRYLPITLQVTGGLVLTVAIGYWLARALGWVR